jgi:hypothetical protein
LAIPLALRSTGRRDRRGPNDPEATVKRHLANIYPKMGVNSRGEATSKALSEGYISSGEVTYQKAD